MIDGGLGLKTVEVVRDVTGARVAGIDHVCAGHRSSPCPRSLNPTLTLGQLPEGLNAIQTRARDVVDNQHTGPHWTQRVDRSAPEITLSGELVDHATDGQLGTNPGIHVHARDGSTASAATHRSGVKRVRLLLDGVVREDYTAPETSCDNCDRGLNWTIPNAALLGQHTIKIEAWDYLDHYASRTLTITNFSGANGVIDTFDEVHALVDAMAATSAAGRQALWSVLSQPSRDYYIDTLIPDARINRRAFGLIIADRHVRSVFSDAETHSTIAELGTPLTSAEEAIVWDDSPPGPLYHGLPDPDVLAGTPNPEPDDDEGQPFLAEASNVGCDPTEEANCPDSGTTQMDDGGVSLDEPTDDWDATAAVDAREDAAAARIASSWFSRSGARADANAHAAPGTGRTGLFGRFEGADCTNFVSQAWHLGGGLNMTGNWYIKPYRVTSSASLRVATNSWKLTRDFVDYMVNRRQIASLIRADPSSPMLPAGTGIGDVVEYDWGTGDGWSHLAIVVHMRWWYHMVSQHSVDRRESNWQLGWIRQRSPTVRARMRNRVVHVLVR